MLLLKIKPLLYELNQRILMCFWKGHSCFEDNWSHCAKKLTLRVGLVRLQNRTGKLLKKPYTQQPLALVHSTAEYCDPAWRGSNFTSSLTSLSTAHYAW